MRVHRDAVNIAMSHVFEYNKEMRFQDYEKVHQTYKVLWVTLCAFQERRRKNP